MLELLVTMVIAVILFGTAIPSMISMTRNNRIATQVNDLVSTIAMARTEAIKQSRQVVVCGASNAETVEKPGCGNNIWSEGWVAFVDNDNSLSITGTELVLARHAPLSGGNTITSNGNVGTMLVFTAQGVVGAAGIGNFLFKDKRSGSANASEHRDGTRLICLGMTGRTRLVKDGSTTCAGGGA